MVNTIGCWIRVVALSGVLGAIGLGVLGEEAQGQGVQKVAEHESLKAFEGKWDIVMKTSDGMEFRGDCAFEMGCGGLWLMSDVDINLEGTQFLGRGMDGYDPKKKEFVSVWVDSMSAVPIVFRGKYDEKKEKLIMTGVGAGVDGTGEALWTMVATMDGPDRHEVSMYVASGDTEKSHVVTTLYTRRK